MGLKVTAITATDWPLYDYFHHVTSRTPASLANLTSVVFLNDDAGTMFDRRITFTGTGISTDPAGQMFAGQLTGFKIDSLDGLTHYYSVTFDTPMAASDLSNAITLWSSFNTASGMDAIFRGASYTFTGGAGDDFFEGSNAADVINGNAGDDVLIAFDGNDTIDGGLGDDYIDGFQGDNSITGGAGDDWIVTGTGRNTVSGGLGADYIDGSFSSTDLLTFSAAAAAVALDLSAGTGTAGEALGDTYVGIESIQGSRFNDTLIGSSGAESINGGLGNDLIRPGNGADTIDGGLGIDTLTFAGSLAAVVVNLTDGDGTFGEAANDRYSGIENVIGSTVADLIFGNSAANLIQGGGGADQFNGRGGADTIVGDGDDLMGYGFSPLGVTVNLSLSGPQISAGDASGDVLKGISSLYGSDFSDTLTGSLGNDSLNGGYGDDLLGGSPGADSINGFDGADTISYAASKAAVTVDLGTANQHGGDAEGDNLTAIENIIGSNFADTISGSAASDNILSGGGGNDSLDCGNLFSTDTGLDIAYGGTGDDQIVGRIGARLYGDAGNDFIFSYGAEAHGGIGNDTISGSISIGTSDNLFGDAGRDILKGGAGADTLTGGTERDIFVFSDNFLTDTVTDFKAGSAGDYLDLRGVSNLYFYQQLLGIMTQVGTDLQIDLSALNGDAGDMLILQNVRLEALRPINFLIN